jgi:hypothetical protein
MYLATLNAITNSEVQIILNFKVDNNITKVTTFNGLVDINNQ